MKRLFQWFRTFFKEHKWTRRILIFVVFCIVATAFYMLGSYQSYKEFQQRFSFTTRTDFIAQSHVTENLMSREHGQKTYYQYVNAFAMKEALRRDGHKISKKDFDHYAQRDAKRFKMKHPNASRKDYENVVESRFGSQDAFKISAQMDVARFKYAKQHYDYKDDLQKVQNQLKGMKTHHVELKLANNKEVKMNLSPYEFKQQFGEKHLDAYGQAKKGDVLHVKSGDKPIAVTVLDKGLSFKAKDVKKAYEHDFKVFLDKDVQAQMDRRIESRVISDDNPLIKFNHPFDQSTYKKGAKQNEK